MGLLPVALAACLAVSAVSDHIRAADLAPASATFAVLDPETIIGLAPAPGVRRVFSAAELRRIAARFGAQPAPGTDLCVERKTEPLDPSRLLTALESAAPGANLKLLDLSRAPAPEGELVFPSNGLRRASGGAYFWNGWVRYAGARRFSIWVKVAAHAQAPVVVAAAHLKRGQVLDAAHIRLETRKEILASRFVSALEQAIGKSLRRPVRSGTALEPQWLERPPDVGRGDTVKVDVWSGSAHLQLDARAETAATAGQPVQVRSLATRKKFLARVESKGRVTVGSAPRAEEKP